MTWLLAALRSAVFYVLFYGVSAVLVVASVVAVVAQRRWLGPIVERWGYWHLWCVRNLLGIEVVMDGAKCEQRRNRHSLGGGAAIG